MHDLGDLLDRQDIGNSVGRDINDQGSVTGESFAGSSSPYSTHAFITEGRQIIDIHTIDPSLFNFSRGQGINNLNEVVGVLLFNDPDLGYTTRSDSFVYRNGQMTPLGIGGSANAINDHGVVVGSTTFQTPSGPEGHAYIFDGSQVLDLGTLPGFSSSVANDVNNHGDVVGTSGFRSFLYQDGAMQDLGYSNFLATAINDSGAIVVRVR